MILKILSTQCKILSSSSKTCLKKKNTSSWMWLLVMQATLERTAAKWSRILTVFVVIFVFGIIFGDVSWDFFNSSYNITNWCLGRLRASHPEIIRIGNKLWRKLLKSALFSRPREKWHMMEKMPILIFRPEVPYDESINEVYFLGSQLSFFFVENSQKLRAVPTAEKCPKLMPRVRIQKLCSSISQKEVGFFEIYILL